MVLSLDSLLVMKRTFKLSRKGDIAVGSFSLHLDLHLMTIPRVFVSFVNMSCELL